MFRWLMKCKKSNKCWNNHQCNQCLNWSKKEVGSLPQSEVECPLPRIFKFIFDLKMASFDVLLVVFYAI